MVNHKATHRYSGLLGLMSRDATGQEDKKDSEMKFPKSHCRLNWSMQHHLEVYLPEFESPKFVAGVD